jgi:hypothetical protein
MEQLQIKADQFRKQGRLQDKDLEEIIKEIMEDDQFKNDKEDYRAESTRDKQGQVLKAVQEGLLQIHGSAPNTSSREYFGSWAKIAMDSETELGANRKSQKH